MKHVIFGLIIAAVLGSLSAEIRGRIFNGQRAVRGQFKYIAAVVSRCKTPGQPADLCICGGSLIAPNWILTAAHCLYEKEKVKVYLGATSRDEATVKHIVERIQFIPHPQFRMDTGRNDVALIQIPKTSECDQIKFARLPHPATNILANEAAVIMGWGKTSNAGDSPSGLRWAQVKTMSNEECYKSYRSVVDNEICANTKPPNGSPCPGDSGGPLVLSDTGEVVGVFSNTPSKDGCEKGTPAVYMRVQSFMPWITRVTGIHF